MSRKRSRRESRGKGRRAAGGAPPPTRKDIGAAELLAIVERTLEGALSEADHATLRAAVDTLTALTHELEDADVTIGRLRRMLFGPSSEKTRDVVGDSNEETPSPKSDGATGDPGAGDPSAAANSDDAEPEGDLSPVAEAQPSKPKGHGHLGADAYTAAERVAVEHDALTCGQRCPLCKKGKLYDQKPAVILRVRGVAPLAATVYELQRLRCNLCGEVFTARAPPEIGDERYDETAVALLALLRYGYGLPLNRLERLGKNLGIPLPSSTQWDVVDAGADAIEPAWHALIRYGADGEVIHIDDTHARVHALAHLIRAQVAANETDRTGIFTSGVLSTVDGRQVALFFTGRDHAGEEDSRSKPRR